jgi:hypothetical protein
MSSSVKNYNTNTIVKRKGYQVFKKLNHLYKSYKSKSVNRSAIT